MRYSYAPSCLYFNYIHISCQPFTSFPLHKDNKTFDLFFSTIQLLKHFKNVFLETIRGGDMKQQGISGEKGGVV